MPGVGRRRFGSIADDLDVAKMNGESSAASSGTGGSGVSQDQLDALKNEILQEMRREVNQMKQEIIEGRLCLPLNGMRRTMSARNQLQIVSSMSFVLFCSYPSGDETIVSSAVSLMKSFFNVCDLNFNQKTHKNIPLRTR